MAEIPVAALESRQQKLIENARVALERGNFDYVLEVTAQVLKAAPGCLPVRKLQRVAQLRHARGQGGGLMARMTSGLSSVPFRFGGGKKEPARLLETAEGLLAKDPTNVFALKMLAEAAQGLGLAETVAFALDAVREIEPENRENLLALGAAWLAAGKATEALQVADELLRTKPADREAQDLMRNASVAQTVTKAGWENQTTYRDKLRDETQAVSLEQAGKIVTADGMTRRLVDEALARIAREPANLTSYQAVVQGYRQLGAWDDALLWIRRARQQPAGRGDPALEKQEAECALAAVEQRGQQAETALAADPKNEAALARVQTARAELATFKLAEAKRSVERYPNDHAARYALGALLMENGETDAAIAQFQQAQKGAAVRRAALVGLGRCFKAKRLFDLAAAQFTAAKAEPGAMDAARKEAIYELGSCLEAMGHGEAAMVEFKAIYSDDIEFRDVAEKVNAFYARPPLSPT